VLLAALLISGGRLAAQAQTVGQVAPIVTVADLDGKPVRVGLGPGKRGAVVEFWATWCELCRALLPSMRAAHEQFGDRVDFYGVNVTVNDGKDHVRRYVTQNHPPFITVYDDRGVAVRAFGALATSYVVIIDRNGRVAYTGDGADQNIPAELAKVLAR
jgi:thiol-disulfide isomerase/thioredoxin